jgi:uncharacterized protein YndB with AHSA1/START domain
MEEAVAAEAGITLRLWHYFEASSARVFEAWTEPEALKQWWCPAGWLPAAIEVDLRVGGAYRLSMYRQSGAGLVSVRGRFLEVSPAAKLVYTWRWEGVFPDMPETRVTVEFRPVAGGIELVLYQEDLAMRYCALHLSGWLAAWSRIAQVIACPTSQARIDDRRVSIPETWQPAF